MRFSRGRRNQRGLTPFMRGGAVFSGGFTLVEVVVGLVLMASVLAGSLRAFSDHQKQLRRADSRIAAVAIADDLLDRFSGSREGIPTTGRGPIASHPHWFWQTSIVGTTAPAGIPLQVIRLEVIEYRQDRSQSILSTVDVVEPVR